jgi:hypothetical protein
VQASGGELITQICISGTDFQDLRQNRIGGVQEIRTPPTGVPKPGTVALLASLSLPGILFLRRVRRQK